MKSKVVSLCPHCASDDVVILTDKSFIEGMSKFWFCNTCGRISVEVIYER